MSLNLVLASNLHRNPHPSLPFPRQLPASYLRIHSASPASISSASIVLSALLIVIVALATLATPAFAEQDSPASPAPAPSSPTYQPKFPGDPARSDSEAAALAYMRVVIRAQHRFNKQYGHYAKSLAELVHSGSFTKRMVNPERGDYIASFKGKDDSFVLTMTPRNLDAEHRSFYAEDDGKIHADEAKAADADSPVVK